MKDYIQELANMGTTQVQAITPKVIAAVIEDIRRERRIWGQFYKVNRDLIGSGGREVDFPKKRTGITASWDVSPEEGLSAASMTFSAVTIPIKKGGVAIGFQGEAIRQAQRDVLADAIREAGEVWADTIDLVAFEALFPVASAEALAAGATLANSFVVGIRDMDTASQTIVQASTGKCTVTAANTISYWYVPLTGALSSATDSVSVRRVTDNSGTFVAKDILKGRADMLAKHHQPDVMVMHPTVLTDILYDSSVKFLEASAYGAKTPLWNAELGKVWDMSVIVTTKMPRYGIALLDSGDIGYEIHRKPMKLTRDEYSGMSMDVLYFWGFQEINYGVVNPHAYGAIAFQGNLTELDAFTP